MRTLKGLFSVEALAMNRSPVPGSVSSNAEDETIGTPAKSVLRRNGNILKQTAGIVRHWTTTGTGISNDADLARFPDFNRSPGGGHRSQDSLSGPRLIVGIAC
jgi:hypothetical protein